MAMLIVGNNEKLNAKCVAEHNPEIIYLFEMCDLNHLCADRIRVYRLHFTLTAFSVYLALSV